jgi:hypothetical protein
MIGSFLFDRGMAPWPVLLAVLLSGRAEGQQQPLTGDMMDGRSAHVATHDVAPSSSAQQETRVVTMSSAAQIGDTTRSLLQWQADGRYAAKPLPILGNEASASYQRYLKSFEHPIPEFYDTNLEKGTENGH